MRSHRAERCRPRRMMKAATSRIVASRSCAEGAVGSRGHKEGQQSVHGGAERIEDVVVDGLEQRTAGRNGRRDIIEAAVQQDLRQPGEQHNVESPTVTIENGQSCFLRMSLVMWTRSRLPPPRKNAKTAMMSKKSVKSSPSVSIGGMKTDRISSRPTKMVMVSGTSRLIYLTRSLRTEYSGPPGIPIRQQPLSPGQLGGGAEDDADHDSGHGDRFADILSFQ